MTRVPTFGPWAGQWVSLLTTLAAGGCTPLPEAFICRDGAACGVAGRCEDNGYCAFPDAACDSGWRYGEWAPSSLANRCVSGGPVSSGSGTTSSTPWQPPNPATGTSHGSSVSSDSSGAPLDPTASTSSSGPEGGNSWSDDGGSTTGSQRAERVEDGLVVLYRFDGAGDDVSVVDYGPAPSLELALSGPGYEWTTEGLDFAGELSTAASGIAADHTKLHQGCQATHGLTLEVWATPAAPLEGPSRVLSYSSSTSVRNFSLLYGLDADDTEPRWSARLRTVGGTPNGMPALASGADHGERLSHIVFVHEGPTVDAPLYSHERLYVDGSVVETGTRTAGFDNWDFQPGMVLVVGNEVNGERPFSGVLHLAAVYCRALSDDDVESNFEAGPS